MLKASGANVRYVVTAACLLTLAACGGGGGGGSRAPDADGDSVADGADCAPSDANRWQLVAYRAVDRDGDGHRVNDPGDLCVGTALPSTHASTEVPQAEMDCDDANGSTWRLLSYAARDADGDSFSVSVSGEVCSGQELATGYGAVAPGTAVRDCDDQSNTTWRYMAIYRDLDGDGVGAGAGEHTCVGISAPSGFSLLGYDPLDDPNDPDAVATASVDLPILMRFPR